MPSEWYGEEAGPTINQLFSFLPDLPDSYLRENTRRYLPLEAKHIIALYGHHQLHSSSFWDGIETGYKVPGCEICNCVWHCAMFVPPFLSSMSIRQNRRPRNQPKPKTHATIWRVPAVPLSGVTGPPRTPEARAGFSGWYCDCGCGQSQVSIWIFHSYPFIGFLLRQLWLWIDCRSL